MRDKEPGDASSRELYGAGNAGGGIERCWNEFRVLVAGLSWVRMDARHLPFGEGKVACVIEKVHPDRFGLPNGLVVFCRTHAMTVRLGGSRGRWMRSCEAEMTTGTA